MEAGLRVVGYDLLFFSEYPGEFRQKDILLVDPAELEGAAVIVASPPCDEFSRHDMPWTRRKRPPEPDLTLVNRCFQLAREAGVPLILENVRGAQKFIGPARAHFESLFLWGDGVPALLPTWSRCRRKELLSGRQRADRAIVPFRLARFIGTVYKSLSEQGINSGSAKP